MLAIACCMRKTSTCAVACVRKAPRSPSPATCAWSTCAACRRRAPMFVELAQASRAVALLPQLRCGGPRAMTVPPSVRDDLVASSAVVARAAAGEFQTVHGSVSAHCVQRGRLTSCRAEPREHPMDIRRGLGGRMRVIVLLRGEVGGVRRWRGRQSPARQSHATSDAAAGGLLSRPYPASEYRPMPRAALARGRPSRPTGRRSPAATPESAAERWLDEQLEWPRPPTLVTAAGRDGVPRDDLRQQHRRNAWRSGGGRAPDQLRMRMRVRSARSSWSPTAES